MKNLLILSLLLVACNPRKLDTGGMAQEMRDRQPKHVTPSQLATLADEWGRQLTDSLNRKLPGGQADTAITGPLSRRYSAQIEALTLRQLAARPDPKVREVAAAYLYAARNRLALEPNLQKLQDGATWLYTASRAPADSAQRLWAITFSRKELILHVDVKTLERLRQSAVGSGQ